MNSECRTLREQAHACLIPGTTKLEEQGKCVAFEPGVARVRCEVFRLDSAAGRTALDVGPTSRAPDGAFWIPTENRVIVVELKGNKVGDASEQLSVAVRRLRPFVSRCGLRIEACVVLGSSAPQNTRGIQEKFLREHGIRLDVRRTKRHVLRPSSPS